MTENKITTNITDIAWNEGYGAYIDYVCKTILESVGGRLNSESMDKLSSEQHTLLAYKWLRDEVMEGGFIQLIYNGYAPYVLDSPFPYVIKKVWELKELSKLLFNVRKEYHLNKKEFEVELSDEDFMALYERLEKLNDYGDDFLDDFEEITTEYIAKMVRNREKEFLNNELTHNL